MSRAQAERNIGMQDVALAACEAKRLLLVMGWPVPSVPPAKTP